VQGLRFAQFSRPLFIAEGPDATVSVVQGGRSRRLVIDGFEATGEWAAGNYMTWMGHLPALAAHRLGNALVICFGTGQTADAVRQHRPASLDIVDLSPAVFRAAPYFESNHGVLDDPIVHARVMDGRAFLRRAVGRSYDLITLEPMAPYFAGTNNLYSREFYALMRTRLSPGGVVAQWVPFHLLSPEDMAAVVATFHEAFPYTRLWIDPMGHTGILVGSDAPWALTKSPVPLPYTDEVVAANMALDYRGVALLSEVGAAITDDNQRLAYGYGRLSRFDVGALPWGANVKGISLSIVRRFHAEELSR
jgi:spermidine synthase